MNLWPLHDAAITGERWVIDGNYSKCMTQRFLRATGLILLDISTPASLFRYYRRTIFERERVGALEGGRDSIKWGMIHHIAVVAPKNRKRYVIVPASEGPCEFKITWGLRARYGSSGPDL